MSLILGLFLRLLYYFGLLLEVLEELADFFDPLECHIRSEISHFLETILLIPCDAC